MVSNRKMKQRLGIKGKISNSRRSTAFCQDTPGVFRVVSTERLNRKLQQNDLLTAPGVSVPEHG